MGEIFTQRKEDGIRRTFWSSKVWYHDHGSAHNDTNLDVRRYIEWPRGFCISEMAEIVETKERTKSTWRH